MDSSSFDYVLPETLIATEPASPRDSAKLMVIDRKKGSILHQTFQNLPEILNKGDVLVFNQTKVLPARLFGVKTSGGKVEILLLKQISSNTWQAISKPGLSPQKQVIFSKDLSAVTTNKSENGIIDLQFNLSNQKLIEQIHILGKMPLPPYIKSSQTEEKIKEQYQTIYAKHPGSAAAPTAGLHFTDQLLKRFKEKGIQIEFITLHVGLGTFKPISEDQIKTGVLHKEEFILDSKTANRLNQAKQEGRRIIAVGTTTTRMLESCANQNNLLEAKEGETDIFIQPPYRFKFVNSLITNFHIPKSSLLMLVSAFISEPNTKNKFINFKNSLIGKAYEEAIEKGYRFYSFGDGMLIR